MDTATYGWGMMAIRSPRRAGQAPSPEDQEWIQKIRTCWPWSVLLCPYNARRGEVQRLHAYHMVIPQGGYIRAIERSLLPIVCPPRQDGSVAETKTVTEPSSCREDGANLIPRYGGSQECRGARIGTSSTASFFRPYHHVMFTTSSVWVAAMGPDDAVWELWLWHGPGMMGFKATLWR